MPRGETAPPVQSNAFILSRDPTKAIQDMMSTIDELRDVYITETEALKSIDTPTFLGIQNKKLSTAKRYQRGIEEILVRKDEMRRVDPALKKRLERMQNEFSDLAHENMQALERMQRTMERVGNTVRNAARDAVNKQRAYSYGETGALHRTENKIVSTGVSETA